MPDKRSGGLLKSPAGLASGTRFLLAVQPIQTFVTRKPILLDVGSRLPVLRTQVHAADEQSEIKPRIFSQQEQGAAENSVILAARSKNSHDSLCRQEQPLQNADSAAMEKCVSYRSPFALTLGSQFNPIRQNPW